MRGRRRRDRPLLGGHRFWSAWAHRTFGRRRPSAVSGLPPSLDVKNGENFNCALGVDGLVRCWGHMPIGNVYAPVTSPITIAGVSNVVAIAVSANDLEYENGHACALDSAGAAWCWGRNVDGELGNGVSLWGSETPVRVMATNRFVSITAGGLHTCAVDDEGGAWCWGESGDGRLGDGTTSEHSVPVRVVGLADRVTQIAAGGHHSCALLEDASVWCWGQNDEGQLGDGSFSSSLVPVRVGLGETIAIGSGTFHSCAVERDESVWCWGTNTTGQLGVSGTSNSPIPLRSAF